MEKIYEPPRNVRHIIFKIMLSHRGEDKRIPRDELLYQINRSLFRSAMLNREESYLQIDDRKMRGFLEWLRLNEAQGALICSSLKGGYFLARDQEEFDAKMASDESRALSTLQRISAQRKVASAHFNPPEPSPQLEMPL